MGPVHKSLAAGSCLRSRTRRRSGHADIPALLRADTSALRLHGRVRVIGFLEIPGKHPRSSREVPGGRAGGARREYSETAVSGPASEAGSAAR
jgi:hypothetical protein